MIFNSGLPSCLCSKTEECEITADNELDVVPNITQVRRREAKGSSLKSDLDYTPN